MLQCGHCCYRQYYSKDCDGNKLECLFQTPGCRVLCDYPSTRTSGILKLTHLWKKLNTRWSARIWGNFPPWTAHAKTNQNTWWCFPFLLLAHKQYKHWSLCGRYDITTNEQKIKTGFILGLSVLWPRSSWRISTGRSLECKLDSFKPPVGFFL